MQHERQSKWAKSYSQTQKYRDTCNANLRRRSGHGGGLSHGEELKNPQLDTTDVSLILLFVMANSPDDLVQSPRQERDSHASSGTRCGVAHECRTSVRSKRADNKQKRGKMRVTIKGTRNAKGVMILNIR